MPSKKDYIGTAAVIAKAYAASFEAKGEIADIAYELADVFAADNPRFDRATFIAACKVSAG